MFEFIGILNSDKLFYAFAMLSMNMGSRFVVQDVSQMQERALASTVAKRFVMFCMVFVATRDVVMSLVITFVLVFVLQHLLNENSPYCVIPAVVGRPIGGVTLNEYNRATELIKRFERRGSNKQE